MEGHAVERGVGLYYTGSYWNEYPVVRAEINRRATGDPARGWRDHFRDHVGGRRFERALMLNCGNGATERELYDSGIIASAVGIDWADDLLDIARADAGDRSIEYHKVNTNLADFPGGPFDLVVNHAAAHHITYIDRVFRRLAELLPDDGYFVSWDYIGPHRNQYPYDLWEAAFRVNEQLPEALRQDFVYPHLPTMLVDDPTEAVHSDLVMPTMDRYFELEVDRRLGGAVAYPLLTHNHAMQAADPDTVERWTRHIIDADGAFLDAHPESSFFVYAVGRPKATMPDTETLTAWTQEEEQRETTAAANDGVYAEPTLLQHLTQDLSDVTIRSSHLRHTLDEVTEQLGAERDQRRAEAETLREEFGRMQNDIDELRAEVANLRRALDDAHEQLGEGISGAVRRFVAHQRRRLRPPTGPAEG